MQRTLSLRCLINKHSESSLIHGKQRLYHCSQQTILLDRYKVIKQSNSNLSFDGKIPTEKLQFSFARSGGPGGQNVNKVNTKVDLRFNVDSADWIPEEVKARLKELYATKMNKQGEIVIQSTVHRTQSDNMQDAIERLREYLKTAYEPVQVMEHELGRSAKSDRERIQQKKMNSLKKKGRSGGSSGHF